MPECGGVEPIKCTVCGNEVELPTEGKPKVDGWVVGHPINYVGQFGYANIDSVHIEVARKHAVCSTACATQKFHDMLVRISGKMPEIGGRNEY